MSTSSQRLGTAWTAALSDTDKLRFDPAANQQAAADLEQHFERLAEPIVANLMHEEIPAGIASCTTRGSNSLSIDLPAAVVMTKSFEGLKQWLCEQGLNAFVSELVTTSESTIYARLSIQPDLSG